MAPKIGSTIESNKCPLCTFESKRLTTFEEHVSLTHHISLEDLWSQINGERPVCQCGCGGQTNWNGWKKGYSTVIKGHNGNLIAVYGEEKAKQISDKRRAKLIGTSSWCKGLTKQNDERILARAHATSTGRKQAFDAGRISIWSKGATKETDDRIKAMAEKFRELFMSGELQPWSKGLSKETDDRIKAMAEKVSLTLKQEHLKERLSTLKRLSQDDIKTRVEQSGKLTLVSGLDQYVSDASPVLVVKCNMCGTEFIGTLRHLQYGRCFKCDPGGSIAQHQIADFIKSLNVKVVINDRSTIKPNELDIWIPEKHFAIEYNGLYWHSEMYKSASYHNLKSQTCAAQGISLLHVFEDEWREKRHIVESMIQHKLGITSTKVYARNCEVIELDNYVKRKFFTDNHIDGDTTSTFTLGLLHADSVVAAISIRHPFHKKHGHLLEVARFCSAHNTSVPGSLSRLIKHVTRLMSNMPYDGLISYVDTRLGGAGTGYVHAGFKHTGITPPRFWWTDNQKRYNRFKFRAKLDEGKTEVQVAEEAGVVKIWGCENHIYELRY